MLKKKNNKKQTPIFQGQMIAKEKNKANLFFPSVILFVNRM